MRAAPFIIFALLLMIVVRASAQPATTRAAGDVEVIVSKIELIPTLVSAKLKDVSASNMFYELSRATGGMITPQDDALWDEPALAGAMFSAEWEKQPLWDALREAFEATRVRPAIDRMPQSSGRIQLLRGSLAAPMSIDGAGAVLIQQLLRDASVSYADKKLAPDQIHVSLALLLEPKFRGYAWIGGPVIEKAEDELAHSMLIKQPAEQPAVDTYPSPITLLLDYPKDAGRRIAALRGRLPLQVVSEMASIRLAAPLDRGKEIATNVGRNKLTFVKVRRDEGGKAWRVELSLKRGEKESAETWRAAAKPLGQLRGAVTLLSTKGTMQQTGGSADFNDQAANVQLTFDPHEVGEEPTELRVELPAAFVDLNVKFGFKDLPMP